MQDTGCIHTLFVKYFKIKAEEDIEGSQHAEMINGIVKS